MTIRYNYKAEYRKFMSVQEKEDELLIKYNASQSVIEEIHAYDFSMLKNERRHLEHDVLMDDFLMDVRGHYDPVEIHSFEQMVDHIETDSLVMVLKQFDEREAALTYLLYEGYSVEEASKMLGFSKNTGYRIRESIRKSLKSSI